MNLGQKMRPEDGRWVYPRPGGQAVDLRMSSIPTLYGEDMAIRILSRDLRLMDLENLGLGRHDLGNLQTMLRSPSGLILVTGPAGAGKTTTLYACIHRLNDGARRINTIEDPVEYALPGIRQSQVNPRINLDFPELLRSVLRQSADVILVGEIRDPVTAETTVRAAKSGMLVLATLHAPTAPAAIDSMYALGVHPYFLASSLLGVLAQRLVRTLCPACKLPVDISESPQTFDDVRRWLAPDQGQAIYAAAGCPACRQEGYTGRTGVFEVLRVSREFRQRIAEQRTTRELRDQAVREGMLDVRRSALLKVAEGLTSTEEIMRAIPAEHLLPESDHS
jgi:type II secretory ATPase GspE/PulE/Tfp pilus assembly ATPase PilB-like protein